MALIGKIREKSVLLVIVIFVALMAFVMGDLLSSPGSGEEPIGYGTIAGESVDPEVYSTASNNFIDQDQNAAQQQQKEFTQKDQEAARDKAWTYVVESTILQKEIDALGLRVGQNEFDAYLYGRDGFNVIPELANNFKDSLGRFNAKLLESRIQQMETSTNPEEKKGWDESKKYYTERRQQEKYFALLKQGVYVTKAEAEEEYFAQKEKKSISLVLKRYSDIPDGDIKVTDEDLKAYYDENKNEKKYETTVASREVKFFDIKIQPSNADRIAFEKELATIKDAFAKTKNDSLFVISKSDPAFRFYSSSHVATFKAEGAEKTRQGFTYPANMDSVFQNANIGDVVGPYADGENQRIAKVIDFNKNSLKVRHILLTAQKGDSAKVAATRKTGDSLVKLINKNNFEEYVTRYSEDPGSKDKGGVYEDFLDYEMVPEFSKFATDKAIGEIGMVQTDYGFHIMEVLDRKLVKFPVLAIIQKTLKPSIETVESTDAEVYDLLYKLDNAMSDKSDATARLEVFDTIAKQAGYVVRPAVIPENKPTVYGFSTSIAEDKVIKLAYGTDAEVGMLCSSPIKDKDRYVIAVVTKIKKKGVPAYESVMETMKMDLIKEKKAKRFIALLNGDKNIESLAKKVNAEVVKAEVNFGSSQIRNVGFEPEIIGAAFSGLKDGQTTIPLKGRNGVYVVRIDKTVKAPATTDYTAEKSALLETAKNGAGNTAKAALLEKAEVVDNRRFSAIGIRR
jgi:peptidyl-prolyl cis-trans isomerase D